MKGNQVWNSNFKLLVVQSKIPDFGIRKLAFGITDPAKICNQPTLVPETHCGAMGGQKTLLDFTYAILSQQLNANFFAQFYG